MHFKSTDDPQVWRAWYDTRGWRRRSRLQKRLFPLCAMCEAKGLIVAAEIADHIEPHKGDWIKFMYGDLQSLCGNCHSGEKRQLENKGYITTIGTDGWPVDLNHPSNRNNRNSNP